NFGMVFALLAAMLMNAALASEKAQLTRDETALREPHPGAPQAFSLKQGQRVTVSDRRGYWYRVERDEKGEGWVPLFSLMLDGAPKNPPLLRARARTSVMGVRGLDESALTEAKPDPAAVEKLESYAARPEELDQANFAADTEGSLVPILPPADGGAEN